MEWYYFMQNALHFEQFFHPLEGWNNSRKKSAKFEDCTMVAVNYPWFRDNKQGKWNNWFEQGDYYIVHCCTEGRAIKTQGGLLPISILLVASWCLAPSVEPRESNYLFTLMLGVSLRVKRNNPAWFSSQNTLKNTFKTHIEDFSNPRILNVSFWGF